MNKIGIMQGRICPEKLDAIQIFPISHWLTELYKIRGLRFDYVELLFDKDLLLEKLLDNPHQLTILGINSNEDSKALKAYSVCADYFSSLALLDSTCQETFYTKLLKIIMLSANTNIKIIVIPFFEKNIIRSVSGFERVLDWFEHNELDSKANSHGIKLALEIDLPAIILYEGLSKRMFQNIGICYDLGNARASGYEPENEIGKLKDFIFHVHIKDRKIGGPNVMLGEGDVNFQLCFKSLKNIGYDGLMTLETKYFQEPAIEALRNLRLVKQYLSLMEL